MRVSRSVTVADTLEVRVDVRTVLDRVVHTVEHRLGPAHAHDADPHLLGLDVRLETAKGPCNRRCHITPTTTCHRYYNNLPGVGATKTHFTPRFRSRSPNTGIENGPASARIELRAEPGREGAGTRRR